MGNEELKVVIGANIDGLITELNKSKKALGGIGDEADKLTSKLKRAGEKMGKIGKSMSTYLTLPLLGIGGASVKMASDFEESLNKVDVAFKGSSKEIRKFAETTLETYGIAEGTALDMAALFGDMATSMGVPTGEAANLSSAMVGLAGDLSSFKNINVKEVTTALNGVFTGETESLKRLGIVMTETNLKQFALSRGMSDNIQAMGQAEKVQLRYAYILENTKNAQGDFARTSTGSANQMRIFTESVKELSVSFGEILLPYFTVAVTYVNKVIKAFTNLSPTTKKIIVVVAALVAVIGPLLLGLGFLSTTVIPAVIAGLGVLGTAFGAITLPIALVSAAVVALGVLIYKNFDAIVLKVTEFYNSFVEVYNQSQLLRGAIQYVVFGFKNLWVQAKLAAKLIWAYLKATGSNVIGLFKNVGKVIAGALTFDLELLKQGLSGVKNSVGGAFSQLKEESTKLAADAAKETAENFAMAFEETVSGRLEKKTPEQLKESLNKLGDSLKETAEKVGEKIGESVGKGINRKVKEIGLKSKGVESTSNNDVDTSGGLKEPRVKTDGLAQDATAIVGITGTINNAFSGMGEAIGSALVNGTDVMAALGSVLLSTIGDIAIQLGQAAIGIGVAMMAIKLSFSNPLTAIAAGVALVAIGSVIKGVSGIVSGGGGGGSSSGAGASGFSGSSNSSSFGASGGGLQNVVFEIQGTKLVGVLSNTLARNRNLGGSLSI